MTPREASSLHMPFTDRADIILFYNQASKRGAMQGQGIARRRDWTAWLSFPRGRSG